MGTSMASPHAAGAAALYVAQRGRAGATTVMGAIKAAAIKTRLAGDPDGLVEGLLNARNFSTTSATADAGRDVANDQPGRDERGDGQTVAARGEGPAAGAGDKNDGGDDCKQRAGCGNGPEPKRDRAGRRDGSRS
jgi:subtilisin family serine protease